MIRFVPNEFTFFIALQRHCELLQRAAELAEDALEGGNAPDDTFAQIRALEKEGDTIVRNTIHELNSQLSDYPPKQDTLRTFRQLDRVLDGLELLAGRMTGFEAARPPGPMLRLAGILHSCSDLLAEVIGIFGEGHFFTDQIGAMSDLVNEADEIYVDGIRDLFAGCKDPVRLLQMNEIYGQLVRIIHTFDDCVEALEDASLKGT